MGLAFREKSGSNRLTSVIDSIETTGVTISIIPVLDTGPVMSGNLELMPAIVTLSYRSVGLD